MSTKSIIIAGILCTMILSSCALGKKEQKDEKEFKSFITADNGWKKYEGNPVLGGPEMGTCFDVNVIEEGGAKYNMYFSWRPHKSIAVSRSDDGVNWSEPVIVLHENPDSGWEEIINRSTTVYWNGQYHMWYTGQVMRIQCSRIGYAVSDDGINFRRVTQEPVLVPERVYEGLSVMNPYVMRDDEKGVFRMWYCSGEFYEPNVICYAESKDGIHWEKSPYNPVFYKGEEGAWDGDRVGGCEVRRLPDGRFIMFYIGYYDIDTARIGAAISDDGITNWKRLAANPLVEPTQGSWDGDACYKPSVYLDAQNGRWMLWYNGRCGAPEYIGLVTHEGLDLGEIE